MWVIPFDKVTRKCLIKSHWNPDHDLTWITHLGIGRATEKCLPFSILLFPLYSLLHLRSSPSFHVSLYFRLIPFLTLPPFPFLYLLTPFFLLPIRPRFLHFSSLRLFILRLLSYPSTPISFVLSPTSFLFPLLSYSPFVPFFTISSLFLLSSIFTLTDSVEVHAAPSGFTHKEQCISVLTHVHVGLGTSEGGWNSLVYNSLYAECPICIS